MAFDRSKLALLSYANGFKLWQYQTPDAAAVVDSAGYFNTAIGDLNVGDVIFAHVATGGTPGFGIFAVTSNDGTNVDVADMVTDANLLGATLKGANFTNANLSGANFMSASFVPDLSEARADPERPPKNLPDDVKRPEPWIESTQASHLLS